MPTELDLLERKLADRIGPVLSDGTSLDALIDLEKREVSMRVLADPELHRLELKHIFARSWVIVGHESEIPNPGDFVLRHIGEDPVIVTRDRDGRINVLLNVCAHRGMEVCWADTGNQSQFKCPYHGWVFDGSGALLGAPFELEMYGEWDKSTYSLRTARVETRCGVIFGNFDPRAESLDEYLGDFGWYFDCMFGRAEVEALGPPIRFVVDANWKAAAEQNSGDGYHSFGLHHSLIELGLTSANNQDPASWGMKPGLKVSTRGGHGVLCLETFESVFGQERAEFPEGWFMAGLLFPGAGVISSSFSPLPDMSAFIWVPYLGGVIPRGHGSFEFWQLPLVERNASPSERRAVMRTDMIQTDLVVNDDTQSWPSVQRSASGAIGREQTLKYNTLMGESRPPEWPGPGVIHSGFSRDDNQWNFWLRWFDVMTRR